MQDLSDVLAGYLEEIEEGNCSIDDVVKANSVDPDELKALLHLADKIRMIRNSAEISAEIRTRSRRSFFRRLK